MSMNDSVLYCKRHDDAAVYVLGAFSAAETEAYEHHLEDCSLCQREVAELRSPVEVLAMTSPPHAAPLALRKRVQKAVRDDAKQKNAAERERKRSSARFGFLRDRWALGGACACAATVVVMLVAVFGFGSSSMTRTIPGVVAPLDRGATADLEQSGSRSELVLAGMQQPPLGKVYEVWLSRGYGNPQPTSVLFSVNSYGRAVASLPHSLAGVKEILVTAEPDGGSLVPTSAPVVHISV